MLAKSKFCARLHFGPASGNNDIHVGQRLSVRNKVIWKVPSYCWVIIVLFYRY